MEKIDRVGMVTVQVNKQVIRGILLIGLLSCLSCSKNEEKANVSPSVNNQAPVFDRTDLPSIQDIVVPDYLVNQTAFFLSAKNSRFTRFDVTIKSLALIDFNGNVEQVTAYKQPLRVNLAGLTTERLLLVDRKVFAADYERLLITLDTKHMQIETLEQGVVRRENLMHFIGLEFADKDLAIEVGINKDKGVFLTSDSMKQLTLQIDLDKSVKTLRSGDSSVSLFRPSLSVSSREQWPKRFTLLSQGLQVDYEEETIALNTKKASTDKQYYLNGIPAGSVSPLFYKGTGSHDFDSIDGASTIYSLALIDSVSEGGLLLRSLWMSDDPISLEVNAKPDSHEFHFLSGLVDTRVDAHHIVPLHPESHPDEISDKLALGQQGFLVKTSETPQIVLAPLAMTAKFVDVVKGDEARLWRAEQANARFVYSQSVLPSPFMVKVTDEVNDVSPETRYHFLSYLMDDQAWQFIAGLLLPDATEVVTLEQGEFASTSLLTALRFVGDQLIVDIDKQRVKDWPASVFPEPTITFNDQTERIKLTQLSTLGIMTKELNDYRDLYDILQPDDASPLPVHTMKLSVDKRTGHIQAADIVIYHFPAIYDALASSGDALPIEGGPSPTQKNEQLDKQILDWAEVIASENAADDEKVCSSGGGADIKLSSYCRHKKIIAGRSEVVGDMVDRFIFKIPRNLLSTRQAYHQLQVGLTHSEVNLLALHIRGNQGYSPKLIAKSGNIQRIEKIMKNVKKIYSLMGYLFPSITLRKAVDVLDDQLTKTPKTSVAPLPKKVRVKTP